MGLAGRQETYHTVRELDISDLAVEERIALYNTDEDMAYFLESSKGTKGTKRSPWFECPVTGDFHPVTEGVRVRGVLYSREAALDLLEERRRERL